MPNDLYLLGKMRVEHLPLLEFSGQLYLLLTAGAGVCRQEPLACTRLGSQPATRLERC